MTLRILIAVFASALLSAAAAAQDMAVPATTTEAAPAVVPAPDAKALLAELALAKPGDAKAGEEKATVCAACHGLDGNSSDPQYPKLAGQHEQFIATQLVAYKSGTRPNVVMASFASMLSAQDMRDVGAYFSTQTVVPGLADETPIADTLSPYKGQRIVDVGRNIYRGGIKQNDVPACMACHGPSGVGNPGPGYPALGGQHSGYIGAMLSGYKGAPAGDARLGNANFAIMATIAKRLSDEEILAVSSYIEGLHARNMNATAQTKP